MTANPNTACKPLQGEQEEHIMYCTMSAWQGLNNAARKKSFHPVIVTPTGIERNCLGQLYILNATDGTFEGRQQALKASIFNLNVNKDKRFETFIRI